MSTSNFPSEVELSTNNPNWLKSLLREEFYDPCFIHPGSKQNEKNIFCLDCCMSFCCNCSSSHFSHRVLQIRKYNDHRVVKAEDMEKLIDCSLVQQYTLNRALVVFLKERSPSKKKEKANTQAQPNSKRGKARKLPSENCEKSCASCPRTLKEENDYCSIACMVKHVLETEGTISGQLRECRILPLQANLEESNEEPSGSMINDDGSVDRSIRMRRNNEEPVPHVVVGKHRRKGIPNRAPLL